MTRQPLSEQLIKRVLPGAAHSIAELEDRYPPRSLASGAVVSRVAPSPTGFMHTGTVYQALIAKKLTAASGGVFYLRLEDTDTARTVPGADKIIMDGLNYFGLNPDEGQGAGGAYGPYLQSERKEIYDCVAAEFLRRGLAYPCFMTQDEIATIRESQKTNRARPGIYGAYARDRDLTNDQIAANLDAGKSLVIRLYSTGDAARTIVCNDLIRGDIEFPENDLDIPIIKSDGLPTYHFAHLCDDHFMRTTHVVRTTEWLASLPLHIQLFRMIGWNPPLYMHPSTIDKLDRGNRRKLSKRKDPETNVEFFMKSGYPRDAVLGYCMNLINSGYEEFIRDNPKKTVWDFDMRIDKMSASGAIFDMAKLDWFSREHIGALNAAEIYENIVAWARTWSPENSARLENNREYLEKIFDIERVNTDRVRKDFVCWSQTLDEVSYFFDGQQAAGGVQQNVINKFLETFDISDDKDIWWGKIVAIADELGIKNGEAAMALRAALTGRRQTPDLYSIMQVMGEARVRQRLTKNDTDII
ncbi:MAG: glutamate--tRNA ligase [Rickettsiales bacterium]|nr:glutamate--tRNA ligase [Rickettsiales bacterium]